MLLSLDEVWPGRGLIDHILVVSSTLRASFYSRTSRIAQHGRERRGAGHSLCRLTWLVGQNFNWAKRKCYSTTKKICATSFRIFRYLISADDETKTIILSAEKKFHDVIYCYSNFFFRYCNFFFRYCNFFFCSVFYF